MRKAAIDLGTNSCLLTIADVEEGSIQQVLTDQMRIVRLGQDIDRTGQLHPDAIDRTMEALREYRELCTNHQVASNNIHVVATSAMRDATNRQVLIDKVHNELDLSLQVIPGEQEALWSWSGALTQLSLPEDAQPCLLDIGGGSTELVWDQGQQRFSLQIGSVRATERYIHGDPPTPPMLQEIRDDLLSQLQSLPSIPMPNPLIAVAGTATTLLAIVHQIEPYDTKRVHGTLLHKHELSPLLDLFCNTPVEQRRKLKGLHPKRADVIPAGAQILLTVYEYLNIEHAVISDRGLRYGVLLK